MTRLEELRDKATKLATDMQAIMAKARTENRELNEEENASFDAMNKDREKVLASEKRELIMADLESGSAGRRSEPMQPTQQPRRGSSSELRVVDAAQAKRDHGTMLQAFFNPNFRGQEVRDAAQRLGGFNVDGTKLHIVLPSQALRSLSDASKRAWAEQFANPELYVVQDARTATIKRFEQRDLTAGVFSPDNTGHYALQPSEMLRTLEEALLAYGGIREVATVTRSETGVPLPFPTLNDTSNKGAIIGETTQETSDVDPPFAQPVVLHAYTYSSKKVPVSIEFLQDNAINFEARIGEILGTRIGRIQADHFTTGDGSGKPYGIVTGATASGITGASQTAVTYSELMGVEHSVDPAYRMRGPNGSRWMFNDNTLLMLKKILVPHFSGDTGGWPLWRPGLTVGEPDTIDGYYYSINQSMASPGSSAKSIIFGALSKYQIRDVRLIEIVRLNELRAEYREVEWFAFMRSDGKLLDAGTHPVKYFVQAS